MIIPKLVKQGLGASAIIRDLRGRGLTYRRASMLADVRREVGMFKFGKAVVSLGGDVQIPKSIMVETELSMPRKYRVIGTARYVNPETGYAKYQTISFFDNTLREKDAWADEYIRQQPISESQPEYVVEQLEIFCIEHNEGYTY